MKKVEKKIATVKSADRVLDIFELFAEVREPMNLMEISRRLELPTSSTYKILQNLLARKYLETDKHEKLFFLGYKIFEIGTRYVQNTDLTLDFNQIATRIVEDINEAVFLSIRDDDKILYIAERQSTHPIRFVSHRGMKLPLHATAMGKVLLSAMETEEIRAIYPQEQLGVITENTVYSIEELMKQLEDIRSQGLSYSRGEAVQGVCCVAAPIYNSSKHVVAAMSISIPTSRLNDELWQKAIEWVKQASKELSLKLYFQQNE